MQITVVGQGYVGLPLAITASQSGYTVYGLDNNDEKIASLKLGKSIIEDLSDDIGMDHFNLLIDINIPEISDEIEMSKIATYLDDFLQSMGDESVVFNDRSNFGRFFLPVLYKINGKIFRNLPHTDFIDESEFVSMVPEKYFID